jgi:hypothetical protein
MRTSECLCQFGASTSAGEQTSLAGHRGAGAKPFHTPAPFADRARSLRGGRQDTGGASKVSRMRAANTRVDPALVCQARGYCGARAAAAQGGNHKAAEAVS